MYCESTTSFLPTHRPCDTHGHTHTHPDLKLVYRSPSLLSLGTWARLFLPLSLVHLPYGCTRAYLLSSDLHRGKSQHALAAMIVLAIQVQILQLWRWSRPQMAPPSPGSLASQVGPMFWDQAQDPEMWLP
jgi:hypothetical protein